MSHTKPNPPAQGARLDWQAIPAKIRQSAEQWLGSPVIRVESQPKGFSPGVAARLETADGRRVFVKAVGPEPNHTAPLFHRREAQIAALLPASAPVPRLLWSHDDQEDTGWVTLMFEHIEGKHPAQPWQTDELKRVLDALARLSAALTPSPLPDGAVPTASERFSKHLRGWQFLQGQPDMVARLDEWSARYLAEMAEIESRVDDAVKGNTLIHLDIREDNLLLTDEQVWVIDWPHACVGAAWLDLICFVPSVTMQGGPAPESIIAAHPTMAAANQDAVTAAIVPLAGFFTYQSLKPPPPGLPTLREFQAAQALVAREWIAARLGWA